jgi:hypothetical protein
LLEGIGGVAEVFDEIEGYSTLVAIGFIVEVYSRRLRKTIWIILAKW